ncbi:hypothetical protein ACFL3S_00840 [Gemmatimonadota bacterium]
MINSVRRRPLARSLGILVGLLGIVLFFGCQPGVEQSGTSTANEKVQNRGEGKDNWYDALPRPEWSEFELVEQSQREDAVPLVLTDGNRDYTFDGPGIIVSDPPPWAQ